MRTKRSLYSILVCAAAFGYQNADLQSANAQTVAVEVEAARRDESVRQLTFTGEIQSRADVAVYAKVPGQIDDVRVDVGDRVKKGQVLATVDERATLALNVRQAETQVRAASIRLVQAETIAKVSAESNLVQAQTGVQSAAAALRQVEALANVRVESQIEQAEAGLTALRSNLRKIVNGARDEERRQVNQAEASLENAATNLQRMTDLYEEGVITKQAYEASQTQYKVAHAQHEVALEQARLIKTGARQEDIDAVEAQIQQAESTLGLAKVQADAHTWKDEIAQSQARVSQAEALLRVAQTVWDTEGWEIEIGLARTQVESAQVALELAQKRLDDATVVAPFGGIVSKRHVDPGDYAFAAMPGGVGMFEIIDVSALYVTADVSEKSLAHVTSGSDVSVKVAGSNEWLAATVVYISPVVDPTTRTATVKARLTQPTANVLPGMYSEVRIGVGGETAAVSVPRRSVVDAQGQQGAVFVVENGRAVRKSVTLGDSVGSAIKITAGLNEGEQVVVRGLSELESGASVNVLGSK